MRESTDSLVPLHFARETYIQKIVDLGLIPIFISALFPQEDIDALYNECSGVLLMGGSDINPELYGAKKNIKTEPGDIRRDLLEINLARRSIADKKPFLGICRGAQVLNVATGGTLIQHLPDLYPTENHDDSGSYDGMLNPENGHSIILRAGTKAEKIINKPEIRVSSAHHQAADRIGKNLTAAGISLAGVVEILEYADPNYFCFGLQSHPECCNPKEKERGELEKFFLAFAKEAVAYRY